MNEQLLSVTMTAEAAERFSAALCYASAVVDGMAEANNAPMTKAKIEEHAEWLRWGMGRVGAAT
jgi:hypothetical protein